MNTMTYKGYLGAVNKHKKKGHPNGVLFFEIKRHCFKSEPPKCHLSLVTRVTLSLDFSPMGVIKFLYQS